jgi:hypothetical protein
MILRGIAAPSIVARPLDIQKYIKLSKKGFYRLKIALLTLHTHHVWGYL